VLIVDDERLFRQTVVAYLKALMPELTLFEAANGAEALDILGRTSIDVLVTDLQMPVLGGVGLLTELLNRGINCSIIITTAYATPEVARWALSSQAFALLEKPLELAQLETTVRALLDPAETSRVEGVTLPGICQLLQMERKTCQVRVSSSEGKGRLTFIDGKLTDALHELTEGDAAALEIFAWPSPTVEISGRVAQRTATVFQDLRFLLMEAARIADERALPKKFRIRSSATALPVATSDAPAGMTSSDSGSLAFESAFAKSPTEETPSPVVLKSAPTTRSHTMPSIKQSFTKIMSLDGFIGVSLVDSESGMSLGAEGGGSMNLDIAAAANSEVVRAKRKAIAALGLDDKIEDILISLGKQYHLIRPMRERPGFFFYLALDRARGNLALARAVLAEAERTVEF
jgi:CheY-like chemotaxis protein